MADVLTISGGDVLLANLAALAEDFSDAVKAALASELEIERTESMRNTPVDTGALRASHTVEVTGEGQEIIGTIGVGGPAAPYAIFVHENLEAHHPVGKAKFLEDTITESAPFLAERIATRINLERLVR